MNTNPTAKTILCYGDSNTWGQRADKGRYPVDVRWTGRLQRALGEAYYLIEEGLSSRTTDLDYEHKTGRNGRTYLEPCLDSHRPLDMIILMLGTNDIKIAFGRSASEIAKAIEGLVGIIRQKAAGAQIVLVSPAPIDAAKPLFKRLYTGFYDHESVMKSQELAKEIKKVANAHNCIFTNAGEVAAVGNDGIHLSEEAHARLAELLCTVVRKNV